MYSVTLFINFYTVEKRHVKHMIPLHFLIPIYEIYRHRWHIFLVLDHFYCSTY